MDTGPQRLTPRQREVLQLLADGYTLQEAARELGINYQTLKSHMHRQPATNPGVLAKLDANTTAHAVAIGLRTGEIE